MNIFVRYFSSVLVLKTKLIPIFILLSFFGFVYSSYGQTYKEHYIAPAPWQYWSTANEIVVSTNTAGTTVVVKKSDGTSITTLSPSPGNPAVYRFTGDPVGLTKNNLNTVLNGAGIIVTGNNPISVNVRNIASDNIPAGNYNTANDQYIKGNASLFSFGDAAIGNSFRVGYYRDGDLNKADVLSNVSTKRPVYSVMAIENNTTVSLNGTAITTLNAGQSYILQASLGSLVETSGPAVMNTGINVDAPEACGDGAYNPIPPVTSLGNEYVVVRGKGNNTAEQTTVVASEPNTTVNVYNFDHNGALQSTNTYNLVAAGSFVTFPNGISTGTSTGNVQVGDPFSGTRIMSTKNVVAYSGTAYQCEVDIATLAPINSCAGSLRAETYKFRSNNLTNLTYFAYIITKSATDKVYITTNTGSPAYNNVDLETIPGVGIRRQLGSSGAYVIDFDDSTIGAPNSFYVSSESRLTVAIVQSGGQFSMSNFLSPFPEKALKPTYTQGNCASAILSADPSSLAPFQWYLNGTAIPGATNNTHQAAVSGTYTVTSKLDCGISGQSLPITIALCNVDLIATKTVDNTSPSKGGTVNFTINVKNSDIASGTVIGTGNAIGVSATDLLPSGYTYISSTVSTGTSYNPTTGLWSIGGMAPGQTVTLKITAKVNTSGIYTNSVHVTGPQNDPVLSNNTATATVAPVDITLTSVTGTDNQSICVNSSTAAIRYQITGTPVVTVTGLALTGLSYNTTVSGGNTILNINAGTISAVGTYPYTIGATYAAPSTTSISTSGSIVVSSAVGAPVFNLGSTSSRCQGYDIQTYNATASNSTSISYSINPSAAGVINSGTGEVTWSSIYNGTATITATAVGICGNVSSNHVVTIASTGTISGTATVCSGSSATLTLSNDAPATVVRWESSIDNGTTWLPIDNTAKTYTYSNILTTTVYRAVVSGGNCTNAYSGIATVTVTPRPVIDNQTYTICKTGSFNFAPVNASNGTTYTWSSPTLSSSNITGGTARSNQLAVNQTLTNNGTSLETAIYTVTPTYSNCSGIPFTITVNVVPSLVATASNTTACSGTAFSVLPTSNVNGTSYSWTATLVSGTATGFSNQSSASLAPISQVISNTSGVDATVRYTVTPSYNGCTGNSFTFSVIVKTLTAAPTTSNQTFCEIQNATVSNLSAIGTGIKWYAGSTGGTALTSTIALTDNTTYYASQTVNGCESATRSAAVVTIYQTPKGFNDTATLNCIGTFNYDIQASNINNTSNGGNSVASSFTWTVSSNSNVNGASNGTGNTINQTLINLSNSNQTIVYTVAPKATVAGACTGNTFTITVTVPFCSSLSIAKVANLNSVNQAGSSIGYTITITNTGNANQTNVSVSDPLLGGVLTNPSKTGNADNILEKGEVWTYVGNYLVTQADLDNNGNPIANSGKIINTASVQTTELPTPKTANSDVIINLNPAITLVKTGVLNLNGNTITYTFTIKNTGNVTVNNLSVSDSKVTGPISLTSTSLIPGATSNGTANYTITGADKLAGSVTNTATATGKNPSNGNVTDVSGTAENNDTATTTFTGVLPVNDEGFLNAVSGGVAVNNVLANDKINGAQATVSNVTITPVSTTNNNISVDPLTGKVNVVPNTPAGDYYLVYQIVDKANSGNVKQATVTVHLTTGTLTAVNDNGTSNSVNGGTAIVNVLSNDTYNGTAAAPTLNDVMITAGTNDSNGKVVLDAATGKVTVFPNTPAGIYTLSYTITDRLDNTKSSTATIRVTVSSGLLVANDDTGSINGLIGGIAVDDVLVNDAYNDTIIAPTLADVNLTQVSTSNQNITLDVTTGKIIVQPNTASGNYIIIYQIVDKLDPAQIRTASVTVTVGAPALVAVADSGSANGLIGGTAVANVLSNDSYNGSTARLTDVVLSQVSTTNPNISLDPATGNVNVAANTPAGSYTLVYQIEDRLNPGQIRTANVTVTVGTGTLLAKKDEGIINGFTGGIVIANILANDQYNGTSIATISTVSITQLSTTNSKINIDTTTGAVNVAAETEPGIYTLEYSITDQLDASKKSITTVVITIPNWMVDLQISKIADVTGVETNGNISYTINIKNNGPAKVLAGKSIGLIENLPIGLGNIVYNTTGGVYDASGNTFKLNRDLASGEQVSLIITGRVAQSFNGTSLVNQVSLTPAAGTADLENSNDQAQVTTPILKGKISLVKSGVLSADGNTINYTFTVLNMGNVELSQLVLVDAKLGLNKTFSGALAVGAQMVYSQVYTLSQNEKDSGSVSNSASITSKTPVGNTVTDISGTGTGNDDPTETSILSTASFTFKKIANLIGTKPGEFIHYTFTVTNTGNVTLNDLALNDASVDAGTISPVNIAKLLPGTSINITAKHTLTQIDLDNGSFTNQASIAVKDNKGNTINQLSDDPSTSATNDATVTYLIQRPSYTLTKSAIKGVSKAGDIINYNIVLTNTGNVTLSNIVLVDADADVGSLTPANIVSLLPDAYVNIGAKHTVNQNDVNIGTFSNQVTATAKDPKGNTIVKVSDDPSTTAIDDATVVAIAANPSLRFTKEVNNSTGSVIKVIKYGIKVTNTGNITLTDIVITDQGADEGSITPRIITKLEPAETVLVSASHTLLQNEIDYGRFVNQAVAVANFAGVKKNSKLSDDPKTLAPDDATVFLIPEVPGITLVKTGTLSTDGNTIIYSFIAKNTGNVTLSNFSLSDAKLTSGVTFSPSSILPGESAIGSAVYTLTQAEKNAGNVINTATLTANTPSGAKVYDISGTAENNDSPTILELAKLTSTKTVSDANNNGKAEANEVLTYSIIVKNNGATSRTGVKIVDPIPANTTYIIGSADNGGILLKNELNWNNLTIPADGQVKVNFRVTVNPVINSGDLSIMNTATVTDPGNTNVPIAPSVLIPTEGKLEGSKSVVDTKGNKDGRAQANEVLTYSLEVKNTGGSALNGVVITDQLPIGLTYVAGSVSGHGTVTGNTLKWTVNMQANSSTTLTFDAKVAPDVNAFNNIKNVAQMLSPTGLNIQPEAAIDVDKSADLIITKELLTQGQIATGADVTYKITVTNKGANRATGVTVTDKIPIIIDAPKEITLTVGTTTYTATTRDFIWLVGSLDVNQTATITFKSRTLAAGPLSNSATVKANQPDPNMNDNSVLAAGATIIGTELLIPNLFTPNGDGINDFFEIRGLNQYQSNELTIINRWGNEVFRAKGYQNNWTGEGLNEGTYYYLLRVKKPGSNEFEVLKGYITLIRAFKN